MAGHTFRVFVHPIAGLEAVQTGFSWPACLFGCLWMLGQEMWGLAALWFAGDALIYLFETLAGQGPESIRIVLLSLALFLALRAVAGVNAARWREQQLRRRRYERIATVAAQTPFEAIERAFGSTRVHFDFPVQAAKQS
jgi:hypothetical protein